MPNIVLSDSDVERIFLQTKDAFSDFPYFDVLVAVKLKQAIRKSSELEINFATTKMVAKTYYNRKVFSASADLELVWKHLKVIFQYSYVAILASSITPDSAHEEEQTRNFIDNYPSFLDEEIVSREELHRLFLFWKMVKLTLTIIQPEKNKQTIIDIAGRFESQEFYVTGKG